jgi:hypothetical protein
VVDRRVNRIAPLSAYANPYANPYRHVIRERAITAVPRVQCSLVDTRD